MEVSAKALALSPHQPIKISLLRRHHQDKTVSPFPSSKETEYLINNLHFIHRPTRFITVIHQSVTNPTTMASFLTALLACPLALLSIYAGQKSYLAINNLHSDENRAEKAAEHSKKAWRELWRTRLTQASGAATVCRGDKFKVNFLYKCNIPRSYPINHTSGKVVLPFSIWPNTLDSVACSLIMYFHVRYLIPSAGILVAH